jgi:uncharacterized integral membrane protein
VDGTGLRIVSNGGLWYQRYFCYQRVTVKLRLNDMVLEPVLLGSFQILVTNSTNMAVVRTCCVRKSLTSFIVAFSTLYKH